MSHYKDVCEEHGVIVAQCRCPGPKVERKVPHTAHCDRVRKWLKKDDASDTRTTASDD